MPTPRFSNNNQNEGHTQWHTSYRSPSISNINRITLYVFFYVCARFAEYNAKSMSAKPSKHKMKKKESQTKYTRNESNNNNNVSSNFSLSNVYYTDSCYEAWNGLNASYRRDMIQRARFRSNTFLFLLCLRKSFQFLPIFTKKKLILQGND